MPETKSQRMLRLEEEARLGREKEENEIQDDEGEKEPQGKADKDPTRPGGADDDNPKHTLRLDKDFEIILRTIFKVRRDNHEVFEALHSEGIYSWENFIDVDSIFISDLTKATNGNRVPVLYQTKAILKSLLFLYLKSQRRSTQAAQASYYTKEIIEAHLLEERVARITRLEEDAQSHSTPSSPVPKINFQTPTSTNYTKSK